MNRRILAESENYKLIHEFESPVLINKQTEKEYPLRQHYGDPACGLINDKNKFCIVGGEGLSLYFYEANAEYNFLENLYVHSIRQNDEKSVRILIDPWSDEHGVWLLDISSLTVGKISDDPDMRGLPYQETVEY